MNLRALSALLLFTFLPLAVWADDHEAWFATSNGLSHGIFAAPAASPTVTSNP